MYKEFEFLYNILNDFLCILRFFDRQDAEKAKESLDGKTYEGRILRITMAKYAGWNDPEEGLMTYEQIERYITSVILLACILL